MINRNSLSPHVIRLIVTVMLLALPVSARISMRLRGRHAAQTRIEDSGAQRLGHYEVEVNGVSADLSVYGLDLPPSFAFSRLSKVIPLPERNLAGSSQFEWTRDGIHSIFWLLALHDDQTVFILLQADAEAWAERDRRPLAPPESDWPVPPQTRLRFSARNAATRTGMTLHEAPAAPSTLMAAADAQLRADGWNAPIDQPAEASFALYSRGKQTCVVYVNRAKDGNSSIAILQRRGAGP